LTEKSANLTGGLKMPRESDFYPILEKWIKKHFHCFHTGSTVGTTYSKADVVGIRDTGGENSGDVELIVIEVKGGKEPFATASGQARGYSVYANRVYLADVREKGFTPSEIEIASYLGIGLIRIQGKKCQEILSSPRHQPLTRMWMEMARKLGLGQCRICGTFVELGAAYGNLTKEDVLKSIEQKKGLVYWHESLADRKKKMGIARKNEDRNNSWQRRFICEECIQVLLEPIHQGS
jgi:hypothetical protein